MNIDGITNNKQNLDFPHFRKNGEIIEKISKNILTQVFFLSHLKPAIVENKKTKFLVKLKIRKSEVINTSFMTFPAKIVIKITLVKLDKKKKVKPICL